MKMKVKHMTFSFLSTLYFEHVWQIIGFPIKFTNILHIFTSRINPNNIRMNKMSIFWLVFLR